MQLQYNTIHPLSVSLQGRYFSLSLLIMFNRMHIVQKCEDFSAFESAISHYQNAENVQFYKRGSRTIATAQSHLSNKKLDGKLKYYEITFRSVSKAEGNINSRQHGLENQDIYLSVSSSIPQVVLDIIIGHRQISLLFYFITIHSFPRIPLRH